MQGFLGGVSVGALLAAGGLAMLSLSVPLTDKAVSPHAKPPQGNADAAPAPATNDPGSSPDMPIGGGTELTVPGNNASRDADLAEAQPDVPTASGADNLNALEGTDYAPAEKPQVGLLDASQETSQLDLAPAPEAAEAPSESQPQADLPPAPETPGTESVVIAATEPAAVPENNAAAQQNVQAEPAPEPTVRPAPSLVVGSGLAPDIGSAPLVTTLPVIGTAPDASAEASTDSSEDVDATATDTVAAESASLTPRVGTPVVPLTERDNQEASADTDATGAQSTPFTAHSVPFLNPEDRPLMSIVLIDDGDAAITEELAEFPYPLTFAIDPDAPDAFEKMAARRSAGFEVLMLADLARQATPQDAETALEVWRGKLPEAVAILEGVETGVQGNRPLADQVAAAAASAGYGLVTQNSGLNTVQKLALRNGVPAGVVFRDFDGAGQNARAIRRFLDQAAFRAGQEGVVIMLGRLRPETITALLLWGLQDRAESVALAPVSASLKALLPQE
ncbi:hypothetical protein AB838_13410 [Rhodobacteraceae bacterium (ex Bugula neritina AB1)]|nr:hypothetical protein AB838_13410 [Rhodobacteraceae bacterium (ex Bugula neritina AB1)]